MITAVCDGTTVTLYKNGVLLKSATVAFDEAAPVVKVAPAGPWSEGHRFTGKIQDLTIWNSALTPAAVHALLASLPLVPPG